MNTNFSFSDFKQNNNNIKIIFSIILLYLLFLIIKLPASVVLSAVNLPGNLKLSSISGTVWSGKANKVSYSSIDLGSISWKLHPLNILLAELSVDVSIEKNQQYIKTEANFSPSGKIELTETRFYIDLVSLQPLTYGIPFSYAGIASGYFPVSFFYKNNYVGINGKLSLNNMEMTSPKHQSFGDFTIDFRAEKQGATSGLIKDKGGLLNASGNIKLNKNGQFNLSAKLAAREKDSSLEKMILFLGRKDASGGVQLNSNFKLWR